RPRARRACGPGDARAVGRSAGVAAVRGRALHPLRLARRAGPAGPARPPPRVGRDARRRAPPWPALRLPRAALEPRDPAREARAARLPAAEYPARDDPLALGAPARARRGV